MKALMLVAVCLLTLCSKGMGTPLSVSVFGRIPPQRLPEVYGINLDLIYCDLRGLYLEEYPDVFGVDVGVLTTIMGIPLPVTIARNVYGVECGVNTLALQRYGLGIGLINYSMTSGGIDVGLLTSTKEMSGIQIGALNGVGSCVRGFGLQAGVINSLTATSKSDFCLQLGIINHASVDKDAGPVIQIGAINWMDPGHVLPLVNARF